MSNKCIYILCSRKDLLNTQIETFFYKRKIEHDLFIVVDDKCIDKKDVITVVQSCSNPNFTPGNVLSLTDVNLSVSNILSLSDLGKETLSLYKMSGHQSPFIYFENKGYENVLMLEDDMLVVGPINEMLESEKEFAHPSWGILTFPRIDKEPNWRGRQNPLVYEELFGITESVWQSFKQTYQKILIRAPYKLGTATLPSLKIIFKKYLESELIRDIWLKNGDSAKSKNGMPINLFHHDTMLQQNIIYDAWKNNPNKVLGSYPRAQNVVDNKIRKNSLYNKEVLSAMKGYIMHVATGVYKPQVMANIKTELDNIGYDGEYSADTPIFRKSRKMAIGNNWYIQNSNLSDKEKEDYKTGLWLSKNAIIDDMMRTKSGRSKLNKR